MALVVPVGCCFAGMDANALPSPASPALGTPFTSGTTSGFHQTQLLLPMGRKEEKEDNTGCDWGLSPFPVGLPPGLHLALDNPELKHEKEQVPLPHQLSKSFPLKSQRPCTVFKESWRTPPHPRRHPGLQFGSFCCVENFKP